MADLSVSAAIDALRDAPMNAPVAEDPNDIEGPIDDDDDEDQDDAGDAGVDEGSEDSVEEDASDSDDDGEEGPEGATDDAETGEDTGDKGEQDKGPAIDPPVALALDDKGREVFNALPRAAKEFLVEHDKRLVADHTRKTQEVAEKRKSLDAKISKLGEVKTYLESRVEKWKKVDWAKQAQLLSTEAYDKNRETMQREVAEYEKAKTELDEQEASDYRTHIKENTEILTKEFPHLAGEKGAALRKEVAEAAIKDGFDRERLKWMSAREMAVYADALAYRKYMAEKSKKPPITAKKDAKSSGRTITPSSRSSAPTGQRAAVQKVFNKAPTAANARRALANLPD